MRPINSVTTVITVETNVVGSSSILLSRKVGMWELMKGWEVSHTETFHCWTFFYIKHIVKKQLEDSPLREDLVALNQVSSHRLCSSCPRCVSGGIQSKKVIPNSGNNLHNIYGIIIGMRKLTFNFLSFFLI